MITWNKIIFIAQNEIIGHIVLDPFSGSGSILKVCALFRAGALLSSDIDALTCKDSNTNKVQRK